ncbi:MAG TPA: hypothetical protein GXX51_06200 [Firmicutes bacterium]|nr:hypothetical protein [Bacillota bacterium]
MKNNLIMLGLSLGISILVAIWAYRDARTRDSNPFLWSAGAVIGGLMLPFLGALLVPVLYIIFRPKGHLNTCPHCNRKYINYLAFCPHCGKPVKKECLRCHENMELDATECPYCRMKA